MSDTKFTPGPWRLTPYYKVLRHGAALAREPSPNRWQGIVEPVPGSDYGSRSFVVGVGIEGHADDYWLSIKDANANLIASSPDLYAALEASTKWLISERDSLYGCITDSEGNIPEGEDEDADYLRELDRVIDANRAALAKARGET